MTKKRVVVTGMAGLSPLGCDWETVRASLLGRHNAVVHMTQWDRVEGLKTKLACPVAHVDFPEEIYTRKATRSMGRVAKLGVRATELALRDSGLYGDPILRSGQVGVAYGSSSGATDAVRELSALFIDHSTRGITATTYVRMMAHTAPVNIGIFFGLKGRILTTSSACTSGSQAIGYAYETIAAGKQIAMVAGGAEELDVSDAAVFDTLFATSSTFNDAPGETPRPFDQDRDGLVVGEGAGTLILEEYEHAKARGAKIYAEVIGFGTNSDGAHITTPQSDMMREAMRLALSDAEIPETAVGYINAHGTATTRGDAAESKATFEVFGDSTPISSLKSYMGHTLGACGALEAWMTIEMMREDWFAPTINLAQPADDCAKLDYIMNDIRHISTDVVMTNNFAFGGINTSILFRRWES